MSAPARIDITIDLHDVHTLAPEESSVTISPLAARRRLGAELRRLRETAGMTAEDAANALECSTAKISRLENGKGVPFRRDVRDLLELYRPAGRTDVDELLGLADEGRAQDWFNNFRDLLQGEVFTNQLAPASSGRFIELEQDASAIRIFEDKLVPGLLQTKEYIEAICDIWFPDSSAQERDRFVQLRRGRQNAMLRERAAPMMSVILSEVVLLRTLGGPQVMARQLDYLVTRLRGELGFVDFRLNPLSVLTRGALGGPFTILQYGNPRDQDVVHLEGREGTNYLETDRDVERYETLFAELERASLSREASLERLSDQARRLADG